MYERMGDSLALQVWFAWFNLVFQSNLCLCVTQYGGSQMHRQMKKDRGKTVTMAPVLLRQKAPNKVSLGKRITRFDSFVVQCNVNSRKKSSCRWCATTKTPSKILANKWVNWISDICKQRWFAGSHEPVPRLLPATCRVSANLAGAIEKCESCLHSCMWIILVFSCVQTLKVKHQNPLSILQALCLLQRHLQAIQLNQIGSLRLFGRQTIWTWLIFGIWQAITICTIAKSTKLQMQLPLVVAGNSHPHLAKFSSFDLIWCYLMWSELIWFHLSWSNLIWYRLFCFHSYPDDSWWKAPLMRFESTLPVIPGVSPLDLSNVKSWAHFILLSLTPVSLCPDQFRQLVSTNLAAIDAGGSKSCQNLEKARVLFQFSRPVLLLLEQRDLHLLSTRELTALCPQRQHQQQHRGLRPLLLPHQVRRRRWKPKRKRKLQKPRHRIRK